jgi:hypothetical protein
MQNGSSFLVKLGSNISHARERFATATLTTSIRLKRIELRSPPETLRRSTPRRVFIDGPFPVGNDLRAVVGNCSVGIVARPRDVGPGTTFAPKDAGLPR